MMALRTLAGLVALALLTSQAAPGARQSNGEEGTRQIAAAISQTGIDLLRAGPAGAGGNFLISPYSIAATLAMVYSGAEGLTRDEMRQILHLPQDEAAVFDGFAALQNRLDDVSAASLARVERARQLARPSDPLPDPIELHAANRLFVQRGFQLRPAFTSLLGNRFGASLDELDFARSPETARGTINQWVAGETRDRIRDIVPPGALGSDTRVVLANALYMRAPWAVPFERQATTDELFWIDGREQAAVATMRQREDYGYAQHDGLTALAIPYDGGALQFLILLPDQRDGLADLERKLTPELLETATRMGRSEVILRLPKFTIEPPSVPLGGVLRELGMRSAFNEPPGSADFERMAPRGPGADLFLSEVFHQTWLAIDESGSEAAAATVAAAAATSAPILPPQPIEVRVDRPFVFAIQDVVSGATLFLGRVTDPR